MEMLRRARPKSREKGVDDEAVVLARIGELPRTSAERYMLSNLGMPDDDDFKEIERIEGIAPIGTNAYSDGSVRYPAHRCAAIGDLRRRPQGTKLDHPFDLSQPSLRDLRVKNLQKL